MSGLEDYTTTSTVSLEPAFTTAEMLEARKVMIKEMKRACDPGYYRTYTETVAKPIDASRFTAEEILRHQQALARDLEIMRNPSLWHLPCRTPHQLMYGEVVRDHKVLRHGFRTSDVGFKVIEPPANFHLSGLYVSSDCDMPWPTRAQRFYQFMLECIVRVQRPDRAREVLGEFAMGCIVAALGGLAIFLIGVM